MPRIGQLNDEFPPGALDPPSEVSRRAFLKLMAASVALAGATSCTRKQPIEEIVPYVDPPENMILGIPLFYATAIPRRGFARPVVVKQHEGRPTKIEGNPKHPASLGATDIFTQASILQLYDPDRSDSITEDSMATAWSNFIGAFRAAAAEKNTRIRILTGPTTSPLLAAQILALQNSFPNTRWHQHDPLPRDNMYAGTALAFGRPLLPVYNFMNATRIFALDSNFLVNEPGSVRYAREFAQRRRQTFKPLGPAEARSTTPFKSPPLTPESMARLYVAESVATITGAAADHHLPLPASHLPAILRRLANLLSKSPTEIPADLRPFLAAAAQDLQQHAGQSLIIVGDSQPPAVHALAHLLNHQLGNINQTVRYIDPPLSHPPITADSLRDLTADLQADQVDILLILETNPAYTAPADIPFAAALKNFSAAKKFSLHFGLYQDETSALCHWHLPASHPLESWADARAHDGSVCLIQPLISPLYQSYSAAELLAALTAEEIPHGRDLLRAHWLPQWTNLPDDAQREARWQNSLKDGLIADSASPTVAVIPASSAAAILAQFPPDSAPSAENLEINFRPDPCVADGEFSNLGWLQELPKPLSTLTWDNAALISPHTADTLNLKEGSYITIKSPEARVLSPEVRNSDAHASPLKPQVSPGIQIPVLVQPGQPDFTVTLHLGYGRTHAGTVGNNVGVNVYPLRTSADLWSLPNAKISPAPGTRDLARTQHYREMNDREVARARNVTDNPPPPAADEPIKNIQLSLYQPYKYAGYKWGMVVDQSACIGCNACLIACQAENNSPVVGREQVLLGREMRWIRIDTYYGNFHADSTRAAGDNPEIHFQPMLCQQCENAPCEVVCPVGATTHSDEGLNEMTYNRCVGTRYCSNNCPYKVRRFNFLLFEDHDHPTLDMMRNPEVTVRSRGVMEKCTYCVQRINRARINVKKEWVQNDANHLPTNLRPPATPNPDTPETLPVIEVLTACQQVCPTEALIFGDMNDAAAHVTHLKSDAPWTDLNYGVLADLNTQPRTTYLERLRNPHPDLKPLVYSPRLAGGNASLADDNSKDHRPPPNWEAQT